MRRIQGSGKSPAYASPGHDRVLAVRRGPGAGRTLERGNGGCQDPETEQRGHDPRAKHPDMVPRLARPRGDFGSFVSRVASGQPGRAEWHAAGAVGRRLGRQHLVELDLVDREAHPRAGHVQAPDARGALTDLGNALVPVLDQVAVPAGEGLGVVRPQVLLVVDLEPDVLDRRDDAAGPGQLTVGEDVAVDERTGVRLLVVRPRDAVVQQPTLET